MRIPLHINGWNEIECMSSVSHFFATMNCTQSTITRELAFLYISSNNEYNAKMNLEIATVLRGMMRKYDDNHN